MPLTRIFLTVRVRNADPEITKNAAEPATAAKVVRVAPL
jgi:hypothetical protein